MSNYQRKPNLLGTFTSASGDISTYKRFPFRSGESVRFWGHSVQNSGSATIEVVRLAEDGTVVQAMRGTLTPLGTPDRQTARADDAGDYLTDHAVFDIGYSRYTADEGTSSTSDGGCWLVGVVGLTTIDDIDLYHEVVPLETT